MHEIVRVLTVITLVSQAKQSKLFVRAWPRGWALCHYHVGEYSITTQPAENHQECTQLMSGMSLSTPLKDFRSRSLR